MIKFKSKIIILALVILISAFGVSYAFYEYYRVGENHQLITGSIYLKYNENTDSINLTNVFPLTTEKARARTDNFITFTISGLNTTTNKDIWYEIILNEGDEETGKIRAKTKDLVFDLSEVDADGNETLLLDAISYTDIKERKIWVENVLHDTTVEDSKTYKLRMWLSGDVIISDSLEGADYTTSDFANGYASVKVSVFGDFAEKGLVTIGYVNYNVEKFGNNKYIDPTPIYSDNTGVITTGGTDASFIKILGWSTEVDGDVMYLPGEKYTFSTNNITLYPVLDPRAISNVVKENLSLTETDSYGVKYVFGGVDTANYVTYGGKLWRIISVNSDGSVKMITQDNMTTSMWNSSSSPNTDYLTSGIPTYINDTFLPSLNNYTEYLVDTTWDCTPGDTAYTVKPETTCYDTGRAGLITIYEYVKIKNRLDDSYLRNGSYWWTMTPRVSTTNIWFGFPYTQDDGTNVSQIASSDPRASHGIRPVVILMPGIIVSDADGDGVSGNGTEASPYEITL